MVASGDMVVSLRTEVVCLLVKRDSTGWLEKLSFELASTVDVMYKREINWK